MIVHENEIKNPVEIETKTDFKSDLKQDINSENQFECEEDYVAKIEEKKRKKQERNKKKKEQQYPPPQTKLPAIKIIPGQIHLQVDAAQQVLINNNPGVYQRAGRLVRIVTEKNKPNKIKLKKIKDHEGKDKDPIVRAEDALVIAEVDPVYLSEVIGKAATWWKFDERKGGFVQKDCPEKIAKTLISRKQWELPVLAGIIQAPTLRSDGTILETPGYDEETGLFFNPGQTTFPPIPQHPSKKDAIDAREILHSLLKDFPFENKESESVALSSILTGLVRKSIRTAPLHGYSAPVMGTGKSLLADVAGMIATGKANCVISQAQDEAEEQKRLLAVLMEGDPIVCYDNIERSFGSAALCSVLTQTEYKGRILGKSGNIGLPTDALFLATGNNLTFVGDISTRAILCRLDSQCERPEERKFDIDLPKYILQNRGKLVQAALTILRAYYVANKPLQSIKQFGRFEEWSDLIRSALVWLDMPDPCSSRKEIENADPVRQSLGNLLTAWYNAIGDLSMLAKNMIKKAEEPGNEALLDALKEFTNQKESKICSVRLGTKLKIIENRPECGLRLQKSGKQQNADLWRVTKIREGNIG